MAVCPNARANAKVNSCVFIIYYRFYNLWVSFNGADGLGRLPVTFVLGNAFAAVSALLGDGDDRAVARSERSLSGCILHAFELHQVFAGQNW